MTLLEDWFSKMVGVGGLGSGAVAGLVGQANSQMGHANIQLAQQATNQISNSALKAQLAAAGWKYPENFVKPDVPQVVKKEVVLPHVPDYKGRRFRND